MALGREEINRKLLHILSGSMIPAGILYIPMIPGMSRWTPAIILGVIAAGAIAMEIARFRIPAVQGLFYRFAAGSLRREEEKKMTGATYIFAAGFLCAVVFVGQPHIAFVALCMFILGDAAAALVGQSIGRTRIGAKTLEGSLGCVATCLLLCFLVFPFVPGLLDVWGGRMPVWMAIGASVLTAVLELLPIRIGRVAVNDNLTVPLATGLAILLGSLWLV